MQPTGEGSLKPYQVRQLRSLMIKYDLRNEL
ncbi:hypothetical protein BH18ACT11_BH18ACT11_01000 [soil metagenome]